MTGKFVRFIETDIVKEISLKYFLAHLNKSHGELLPSLGLRH